MGKSQNFKWQSTAFRKPLVRVKNDAIVTHARRRGVPYCLFFKGESGATAAGGALSARTIGLQLAGQARMVGP